MLEHNLNNYDITLFKESGARDDSLIAFDDFFIGFYYGNKAAPHGFHVVLKHMIERCSLNNVALFKPQSIAEFNALVNMFLPSRYSGYTKVHIPIQRLEPKSLTEDILNRVPNPKSYIRLEQGVLTIIRTKHVSQGLTSYRYSAMKQYDRTTY